MQEKLKKSLKLVNYIGIGAVALIVLGAAVLGVIPMQRSAKADQKARDQLDGSVQRLNDLHLANLRTQEQVNKDEQRLVKAEERLPVGKPSAAFNNELTEVAKAANIRTDVIPGGAPKDFGAYKLMQFTVTGSGTWANCYDYVARLRRMNQIARLDSVMIEAPNTDERDRVSDGLICQITVKFSTFYREH